MSESDVADRFVYVTKYALSGGIRRCRVNQRWTKTASECASKGIYVDWEGGLNGVLSVYPQDYADTLDAAQEQVRGEVARKLNSLDKQRKKLEKIARDGAKVVEEKR